MQIVEDDSGFQITAGVTVTVFADLVGHGMDIFVNGPAVIEGNIVRGPKNDRSSVGLCIFAVEEIVVRGIIDVSGPADDLGIDGGIVSLLVFPILGNP